MNEELKRVLDNKGEVSTKKLVNTLNKFGGQMPHLNREERDALHVLVAELGDRRREGRM